MKVFLKSMGSKLTFDLKPKAEDNKGACDIPGSIFNNNTFELGKTG